MATLGVCSLCNCLVKESDHRREIICSNRNCHPRNFHEECFVTYRYCRTKSRKNQLSSLQCPGILKSGKSCPGHICKMLEFCPPNQKQAPVETDITNANVPKGDASGIKSKAAAQAATAAMKGVAPTAGVLQKGAQRAPYIIQELLPSNQEKKQAPVETDITNANVPKGDASGIKSKVAAQAAAAAMKGVAPTAGALQKGTQKGPRKEVTNSAKAHTLKANTPQELQNIPGWFVDEPACGRQRSKPRTQPNAPASPVKSNEVSADESSVGLSNSTSSESDCEDWTSQTTMWDAFAKATDGDSRLNYFELERNNRRNGGRFTTALKKRLMGGSAGGSPVKGGSHSDSEFEVRTPNKRDTISPKMDTPLYDSVTNGDIGISNGDSLASKPNGAVDCKINSEESLSDDTAVVADQGIDSEVADQGIDPVVAYDLLYADINGLYLVFDAMSNAFFKLEDIYGVSPQLVEYPGEDGNFYTCVAVRKSQRDLQVMRQMAWKAGTAA